LRKVKRIFYIAGFKDESPRSIRIQPRMWLKGLLRLGHDVQRFNYWNISKIVNRFNKGYMRRFINRLNGNKTDNILVEHVKNYKPDIVFLYSMKYLTDVSIKLIRDAAPDAVFVGRDDDPFPERNNERLKIAKHTDIMITTGAGRFLKTYKDNGTPLCAFIPNVCDPDIQYKYKVGGKYKTDIVFTGKATHSRLDRIGDRFHLIKTLSEMENCRLYGTFNEPKIEGLDYFRALSGAKIALSINYVNDESLYHSDRFINCLACGVFTLSKRVPDTELLFQDGVHLRYFETEEEFFDLADYYLRHESEREKIAIAGMEHAHKEFNCQKIARLLMDLIETGDYKAPWKVIL